MDEQNFGNVPVESSPLPVAYKDRSVGLVVFGILTLLLGCLAGLLILVMLFGLMAAARNTGSPTTLPAILPAVSIYGILAIALIWLGIGSIMTRRWARALLVVFSWSWLAMGLFVMVFVALFIPKMMAIFSSSGTSGQPGMPAEARGIVVIVMMLLLGLFFMVLPAVWTFFYSSRHVKATCDARDPVIRWTDACPLPVLGLCLWLAVTVPMMFVMPLSGRAVMPFFGIFVAGFPASLICLLIAAVWGYAAWSLYKLEQLGWWLILIAMCVFMVSGVITYAGHDVSEMYRLMNYTQAQIDQMKQTGIMDHMMSMTVFSMVPFLGYLLFMKKYLRKS